MLSQKQILQTMQASPMPTSQSRLAITEILVVDSEEYPVKKHIKSVNEDLDLDLDLDFDFNNIQLTTEEMLAIVSVPIIESSPSRLEEISNRNHAIQKHIKAAAKEALTKAGSALFTIKQQIVTLTINHIKYYDQDKSGVVYESNFFNTLMEIKKILDEILEKSFNLKPDTSSDNINTAQSNDHFTESKSQSRNENITTLSRRSEFKTLWYSHKEKAAMIRFQITQLQNAITALNPLINKKIDIEGLKNQISRLLFIIDSAMNKFTNTLPFFTENLVSSRLMELNSRVPNNFLQKRM